MAVARMPAAREEQPCYPPPAPKCQSPSRSRRPSLSLRLGAGAAVTVGVVLVVAAGAQEGSARPSRRRLRRRRARRRRRRSLPGGQLDEAGYWQFVDGLQPMFDSTWREDTGVYRLGSGGVEPVGNAGLLIVHAVAALHGHQGPARQDARAGRMVEALFRSPPYTATLPPARPGGDTQPHAPGWVGSLHDLRATQHMAIDAEIMDALAYAWRARRALGLPVRVKRLIAARVPTVARSRFWRWPSRTLNQINWPATVYSADATVTGSFTLLRRDLRRHLASFIAGVRGRGGAAGNLAAGLSFHYQPDASPDARLNVDSAEYGSIVASFTRFYGFARRHGMAAPSAAGKRLLRQWLLRVLCGYWTHAGYLNWDTGYGFKRWHQSKKIGLAQQALIGIAATPELADAQVSRWAKWMLDRGFGFYARQAARNDGIAPQWLFGVHVRSDPEANRWLGGARMAANAARAIAAGLGRAPSEQPPALYSFDPRIGRLAVTTPAYNTAVVPVSQGAFPYGGIELARLFDADQEVAANIGGRPPAAFGLLVHDRAGGRVLATQTAATKGSGAGALRLTRAPAGVGVSPGTSARRAYAGPFDDLRATGRMVAGPLEARTTHRFTPGYIETRWALRRRAGISPYTVSVLFPSYGDGAHVEAVRRDGSRVRVSSDAIALRNVAYFHVRSAQSGYVVVPRGAPEHATTRISQPDEQSSAPRPGPTLIVRLDKSFATGSAGMTARMAIARTRADAAAAATFLGARVDGRA